MDFDASVPIKCCDKVSKCSASLEKSHLGTVKILSVAKGDWALFKSLATGRDPLIATLE